MYKQCANFGVESVSLLGWKLSGIEHNVRYLSEFSWNPTLGAADFYKNYVRRVYGNGSESIVKAYSDNDAMEATIPCCLAGLPIPITFPTDGRGSSPRSFLRPSRA